MTTQRDIYNEQMNAGLLLTNNKLQVNKKMLQEVKLRAFVLYKKEGEILFYIYSFQN